MTSGPTYDVFLSHNRRQKFWVKQLYQILLGCGLKVFFDEESIQPGQNIVSAIEEGLEQSKYIILILSPSSVKSAWVALETTLAIYGDHDTSEKRLIPVMLETVDSHTLRPAVRMLNYVDLTDPGTRDREFSRLLLRLGIKDALPRPPNWAIEGGPVFNDDLLCVADIDSVLAWKWDGEKLLDELIRLDYETLEGLTPEHEGQISQWAPVFMDHPSTWRLLVAAPQRIVGYWHFVPLFESEFESAKQGQLSDSEITTDMVRLFELAGTYDIYFVTFAVAAKYRRPKAFHLLLDSLVDTLVWLAGEGVFIGEVCANAYTQSGEALCKSLGLRSAGPHIERGKIFLAPMTSLVRHDFLRRSPQLGQLYTQALKRGA